MAGLEVFYKTEAIPALQRELERANAYAVPRVTKVTLNMGVGEAVADRKVLDSAMGDLALISGQKPVLTRARRSVATFKIREDWPIGCKVTLRGNRMYRFLERLFGIAIPRERDFRGLDLRSFDGQGNYNLGIREQVIFPEIDYDKIERIRGLDVCITTSAKNDLEGMALMRALKFPLRQSG